MPKTLPSRESVINRLGEHMPNQFPYFTPNQTEAPVSKKLSYLRAIFPFKANDIAFINSVVLGTNANRVTPKNFSSIPEPSSTTSTTPTRSSVREIRKRLLSFDSTYRLSVHIALCKSTTRWR